MTTHAELDRIAINVKSRKLLNDLLRENDRLAEMMRNSANETEALEGVRRWVVTELQQDRPAAWAFYNAKHPTRDMFEALDWRDYAGIRILDYLDNAGREFVDLNLRGELAVSNPIKLIWLAAHHGTGGAKPFFFEDMRQLFRQFSGRSERHGPVGRDQLDTWMERYPSGLDPRIVKLREENRDRIIDVLTSYLDRGAISSSSFRFEPGLSGQQKYRQMREWWEDAHFHLQLAVRSPELLNELLGESLDPDTMRVLAAARDRGIPFFVNPYYLSLLHVRVPYFAIGADLAIRHYVLYSQQLVDEFGQIVAWEKEDLVEPGRPNAAGWLLPDGGCVHRRYPDVAILIPDTVSRACGGLCAVCQRMYGFQRGKLSFELEALEPSQAWPEKLAVQMEYFERDAQLRDILVTGGDALMSPTASLKAVLEAIYEMARAKRAANAVRAPGQKYAELVRVRLGTRLPVYLPQRITPELADMLARFREKALGVGIEQFVIQTHVESPLEVTPEARRAFKRLTGAGWTVTNQLVMSAAASRRGHTAKLRQVLNEVGVLPYYSFGVKGYRENQFNYTPMARLVQEEVEEKIHGRVPPEHYDRLGRFPETAERMREQVDSLRRDAGLPFLSTDRSVLNLPAVGKSLTFRTIGITRYGRRILEFDHDPTRAHSPIIDRLGKVVVIESKSVSEYLQQMDEIGEDVSEYEGLFGYSLGETEPRMSIYEYPKSDLATTDELTNLDVEGA